MKKSRREVFEDWLVAQFSKAVTALLAYNEKKGYAINEINTLWLGFNAGIELEKQGLVEQ